MDELVSEGEDVISDCAELEESMMLLGVSISPGAEDPDAMTSVLILSTSSSLVLETVDSESGASPLPDRDDIGEVSGVAAVDEALLAIPLEVVVVAPSSA